MVTGRATDSVVELDIGVRPDAGVSGALVLQDEYDTQLAFRATTKESAGQRVAMAVVTFQRCILTRFGYPNDEARRGHPLYKRGLGFYGVFEVLNSSWALSVAVQNRLSFPQTPDDYAGRHFVFAFHDSTFECLANDLKVELSEDCAEVFRRLLTQMVERSA
jgi:hypothetical protein